GQNFIQILPINDTTMTRTWTDSYPYNANSTFALHPLFLRVTELGYPADPERRLYFENLRAELNSLKEIDYERVTRAKEEYSREMYSVNGNSVIASADFIKFVERNRSWLMPYAAFCVLRDRNGTPDYSQWGEYAVYNINKVEAFVADNLSEINYIYYIQYFLDRQMREARDYAHAKGIALKGDIPIGISRTSADAWQQPHLFFLDSQAGAPPDDFSVLGQNWGFPTYNWDEMSRDGFAWWKARFRKMAEYFDAYRIDHILGFFRIWQIPMDALHGLLGVFHPALPFSIEELRERYGFWLDVDLHTTPYIMDYFLRDFFGEYADEARERFLRPVGYGRHKLREEYDTQRKVAIYFAAQEKNEKNDCLCEGLLGLIDQVLFVEDPYEKGKYHPRITGQFTYLFRSLNEYDRTCFTRLYDDFYYHRHNDLWYHKAMWKLPPLIDATHMLTCAEDLGMIPACVPAVIDRLHILSLEIQRMPKDPAHEFGQTWHYPYYSVCTTSTHDMSGIRAWWEENRDAAQRFYNNVLGEHGEAPYFAEPWICDRIVRMHLQSPSMLCILPLQDWLSVDGALRRENPAEEQINVPANPRHYWRYRMHLTLERLLGADAYNSYLREAIASAGR
ncbi:MAG: 4-alpha-glucanotransferase, partial [Muribaculaceae bacterium]|nr:4-alpha-glucanotransferase [Muribaculaceae bacterium]